MRYTMPVILGGLLTMRWLGPQPISLLDIAIVIAVAIEAGCVGWQMRECFIPRDLTEHIDGRMKRVLAREERRGSRWN